MGRKVDRGLTSLDTLIMFIAVVIVVSVVAIILITSGGSITQKTISKSVEGRKGVTSGLEVVNVISGDASTTDPDGTPHQLETLMIMARLLPGTTVIPLNNTLLIVEWQDGDEQILSYNQTCPGECPSTSTSKYLVYYLKEGTPHENGYLNTGDVVKFVVKLDKHLGEDQTMRVSLVPAYGPKTMIVFETPQNIVAKLQTLWPVA
jgi:flagellin-like protein